MGFCEKIKTDVVVCDEIFYFEHDEINVPLGFDAPTGSVLSGVVTVTLSECDVFIVGEGTFVADVLFIVQKELLLVTPDGDEFPLEFVERLRFVEPFRKCDAGVLEFLNLTPEQLRCQIVRTAGSDTLTLDTNNDTFSEELTIELKVKVTAEVQQFIKLCSPRHTVDIPIAQIQ